MKFIVISGADACGKDTQIEKLKTFFEKQGKKTQILSIHSSLAEFANIGSENTLSEFLNIFLLRFEPIARTLFLQSLVKNALDKIKSDTQILIFNGYWYKLAASEAAYGVPLSFWSHSSAQYFPRPDIAIHLNVSIENCFLRRGSWWPYERGEGRYWSGTSLDFRAFQESVHRQFQALFQLMNDPIVHIDGNHSEDQVGQNILSLFDDSPMPKSTDLIL